MTKIVLKIVGWFIGISVLFSVIGYGLGWFSEAGKVAQDEFGAKASLEKYEWFKDCSATLEEKANTIKVYEANINQMKIDYANIPRPKWDNVDKLQYNQWSVEMAGLKANYNNIVKEYNAQASKFNWQLYNTSKLPTHYNAYLDN